MIRPWLFTCIGVAHDLPLLPHWLDHYLRLGVDPARIVVILNAETDAAPGLDTARAMLARAGTRDPVLWIAPYTSGAMWERRGAVQQAVCPPSDWAVHADVDEFHHWPEPLHACLARAEALGANCIQGPMIDRLAPGGRLAPVAASPGILDQFPIRAEVMRAVGGRSEHHGRAGTIKLMAARDGLLPARGGHRPTHDLPVRWLYRQNLNAFPQIDDPAFRFAFPTRVDHIHWTEALPQRLEKRLATPGVSPAGAVYGQRQLDHIRRHGGIALDAVAIADDAAPQDWPRRLRRLRLMGRYRSGLGILQALRRKVAG
ncbi:hypothetical protein OCGS_2512 [Oceaniovalibus guishaninsula JLT2003]|uniref:Glycosyl transferase family 2 n=1 Tax=Oceaniovalibus guishaninsula JLT2003 TaxID=1231392 RepID=K2I3A6_9RHOB|nr:glycosyltransferase family 2 protein [Oceaniovalibus guishaninsula]EKE43380.1 hypothetical protein OCGS_2512 [Oceaniovalibus guishaninsula JLT2003]